MGLGISRYNSLVVRKISLNCLTNIKSKKNLGWYLR